MARLSPSEHAALWAKNFGGSAERYKQGVNKVRENPAAKAIQAQDRLLANFTASVTSGKWAAGLAPVTLASWQQAANEKGGPAIAAAARVAQDKVARAETKMGPIRDGIVSSLPPRGDIEQNLQRGYQMALQMHQSRLRG